MITVDSAGPALVSARRMLVIGCSGSGKSTFSRAAAEKLGLRYISMDREFFWLPGWKLRDRPQIHTMIADAVAGDDWIMDGTSPGTLDLRLPRADLVIWLRMPRILSLWRVVKRRFQYSGRSRPEMADGCSEKIDMEFLRYIWNFERTEVPEILQAIERHAPTVPVLTIRTPAETATVLAQLKAAV